MRCRVLYASMGYNGPIYSKGDYVEVDTPAEVKRLVGYGAVEKCPVKEQAVEEPLQLPAAPEEPGTGIVKGVKNGAEKSKTRGKKK